MAKTAGQIKAEVAMRIRGAIDAGLSASRFITRMREAGLGYRRQEMLADWRSEKDVKKKTGLLKYVRKSYQPTPALIAQVTWNFSREYMYKVRVDMIVRPGEPEKFKYVNIMSDKPMTIQEMEREVQKEWGGWYPEERAMVKGVVAETAIRRV